MQRGLHLALAGALLLGAGGCSQAASSSALPNTPSQPSQPPDDIPPKWRCFPFNEAGGQPPGNALDYARLAKPAIGRAEHCAVGSVPEASSLEKLAVALMERNGLVYESYCTGTPIAFDQSSGIGFVVTAAHCVLGGLNRSYPGKLPGQRIDPRDINVFDDAGLAAIYQGPIGKISATVSLTGLIEAVYVPSRYCQAAQWWRHCFDNSLQNGDLAILKIVAEKGESLGVLPDVQLAPASLVIRSAEEIMALGYGENTTSDPHDHTLYYADYQLFGTNAYDGVTSEASIMNGYYRSSDGMFWKITCSGDSGGGDFYWDGSHWDLVGAHSWGRGGVGTNPCGASNAAYENAFTASADVRPFTGWIKKILRDDTSRTGCAALGEKYVCRARHDS